jgi:preprotein translocase subunit SecF
MSDRTDGTMTTTREPDDAVPAAPPAGTDLAPTGIGRLYRGQTAIDFAGRRRIGFAISAVLLVVTVVSLVGRGLNLGIDFEGGVSWDVPAEELTVDDAEQVLSDNGLEAGNARIQERGSDQGSFIKVQVTDQTPEVRDRVRADLAEAAGVEPTDVSVQAVSASWGDEITEKAVRALLIFLAVVALFISIRFEWRMALAAIVAMVHDVVISVGIYSVFGFVVTPATVIAFLTILGYSLYDTVVVFDRVRENEARYAAHKLPYDDVINISMNQVLMRSLNTSLSSVLPVLSLLIVGTGIFGVATLSEFAIALLVGMVTGAYSSILVATPLLGLLKQREAGWAANRERPRATGEELRALVLGGAPVPRRRQAGASSAAAASTTAPAATTPKELLTHPPRPRKKKRR